MLFVNSSAMAEGSREHAVADAHAQPHSDAALLDFLSSLLDYTPTVITLLTLSFSLSHFCCFFLLLPPCIRLSSSSSLAAAIKFPRKLASG